MLTVLPLYLLGLYLYNYKRNLNKPYFEIKIIIRKMTLTFLTIYSSISIISLIFLNNLYFIRFVLIGITFSFLLISWIFFNAYRGKILPEINCLKISIGFLFYAISQISLPFSALILNSLIIDSEAISVIIMEILSLISFIIILIGFKTKATYYRN